MVDIDDLTEEQLETLVSNPEVRKTLEYDDAGIDGVAEQLGEISDDDSEFSDTFDLFVEGVAERSGRVTEATVRKVITGMVAEANSVQSE